MLYMDGEAEAEPEKGLRGPIMEPRSLQAAPSSGLGTVGKGSPEKAGSRSEPAGRFSEQSC